MADVRIISPRPFPNSTSNPLSLPDLLLKVVWVVWWQKASTGAKGARGKPGSPHRKQTDPPHTRELTFRSMAGAGAMAVRAAIAPAL